MINKYHTPHCKSCVSKSLSILCGLGEEEVDLLDSVKSCDIYDRGEVLFEEGSRVGGFFCVSTGKIKIYKQGSSGREQIIRFAKPGDVIGYKSLLSHEPLSVTAESIEDATVCFVPKEYLYKVLSENQEFNFKVLETLSHELGKSNKSIVDVVHKPAKERLAETLLMLRNTFNLDDKNIIQVRLSREELGNIVGTATESLIRLLSELKKERIIELEGKDIKLINIPALVELANLHD